MRLSPEQRTALASHPAGWIAAGLGPGFAPIIQGTVGSAVALLPWMALRELPPWAYVAVLVAVFAVGVWACEVGGRLTRVPDHSAMVIDEYVGQWLALLPAMHAHLWWTLPGFMLFRLFDIWKPWPVGLADRGLKGGLGVMVDDVIAGLYAAGAMVLLMLWVQTVR